MMWCLHITNRLRRLYKSERTAEAMRWHAESVHMDGEVLHPSYASAWKHFIMVHKYFTRHIRNVYLELCTDGLSPIKKVTTHIWNVYILEHISHWSKASKTVTRYFSSAIDIKVEWLVVIRDGDVLLLNKNNFMMPAVLMWNISDFPT